MVNYIIILFQEAQNPPRPGEGGRQLGKDDARRTNLMNWLSRCSILWYLWIQGIIHHTKTIQNINTSLPGSAYLYVNCTTRGCIMLFSKALLFRVRSVIKNKLPWSQRTLFLYLDWILINIYMKLKLTVFKFKEMI